MKASGNLETTKSSLRHGGANVPLKTPASILASNSRYRTRRAKKNPHWEAERKKAWRKNNARKQKTLNQKSCARHRTKLADGYVRRLLAAGTGRKPGYFTQDAVELKRMQLQLQRMFKRGGKLAEAL